MGKQITLLVMLLAMAASLQAATVPDTSTWARFSAFSYSGKGATTAAAGEYINPIIAGFYPDPSVCRVGDDYYLVNSSFNYFPGIPVWHSKDLVNWTQIGNVIDRPAQFAIHGGAVQSGTYAPTIRFHNGMYYVVCTFVGGIGNFYVTATDPKGPWSDPIRLQGIGGIDPSFFFDDDGKCYVTNCDDPQGATPYNGQRTIRLQQIDLDQKRPVGEQTVLVNGGTDISRHPVWCEGPHLYKINGAYYLMCAQGGTGTAHSEVIFRSDALRGPYVPWEKNPILTAMDLPAGRADPVTCTGHADLVQTQTGDWYSVFLGCQPYEAGFYNTGRQTFLLPVAWENNWPVILPPRTPVPLHAKKPGLPVDSPAVSATTGDISFTDDFENDALAFRWIGLRAPASQWWVTSKAARSIFLLPRPDRLTAQGNPSFLAVRQQNNDFTCTVNLIAQEKTADCVAGLVAFQNETHLYAIDVQIAAGKLASISIEQPARAGGRGGPAQTRVAQNLPENLRSIQLKIEGAGPVMRFFCKTAGGEFTPIEGDQPSSFLSTDTAGGFQGVTLGMFARD